MNNPGIPVERFQPEKDATDTQIGIEKAIELKSTGIWSPGGNRRAYGSFLGKCTVPGVGPPGRYTGSHCGSPELYYASGERDHAGEIQTIWNLCFPFFLWGMR